MTPRRTAAALAAAALTLTLAACSGNPGNPAAGPGSDETPLARDGVPEPLSTGPEAEAETAPEADAGGGPPSPPVPQALPEDGTWILARVGRTDVAAGADPLRRVGGGFVEVSVTVRVQEGSISLRELLGPADDGNRGDMSGVELVDLDNGRVHRVARDAEGLCVCSRYDPDVLLYSSDSVTLSGTYAAPPSGVDSMTVRLPFGEALTGVPLVRG